MTRLAVIDFETTGLSPAMGDRATEVAIVLVENGCVVDRFQSLMNAGVHIPAFITSLTGIMIESHLHEGRQDIVPGTSLRPAVSVTDACISMAQTVPVLEQLARAVRDRRKAIHHIKPNARA